MNFSLRQLQAHSKIYTWTRRLVPVFLIIAWFGVASFGGPTFGKLSSVSTNDQAAFLPASAQSTKVQEIQAKFRNSNSIPALIVFESDTPISPASYGSYRALVSKLGDVLGTGSASTIAGPIPSADKKAVQFIVPLDSPGETKAQIAELRSIVKNNTPVAQTAYVTGPAGLTADLVKAFGGIDGVLLIVALFVVFVILLLVYRSLILPFLVLMNAMFALCGAILIVFLMAKWGWIELNGQSQGILSILVIGAATDYSLLLVARYRETLEHIESKWSAMSRAFKTTLEPILASGFTVIAALLCLLFSDLNSNRSLGPIAATGIVFSLLSTLSFLPALLVLFGRVSFWPTRPKHTPESVQKNSKTNQDIAVLWRWVGTTVTRRPRLIWISTFILLGISSVGLMQLKANGVPQTDLILTRSEAVDGQAVLAKHFDSTIGTPMVVVARADDRADIVSTLKKIDGITTATVYSGEAERPSEAITIPPKVVDGKVLIYAIQSTTEPDSEEAEAVVNKARAAVAKIDPKAMVGGTTAIALDTNVTAKNDLMKIIPIVLVVIFIILALLLRALVAPLILIATVIVSYTATLGISAVVFNHILGFPGADASVPLFGFVFLVALGIDYNIFLMTRVREEAQKRGTSQGIVRGLGKTGGVITSAGVVLAATFAALGIIPILFLAQLAFIVAFGVLLDTIIVRSLLVPALSYDVGRLIWWPSRLGKNRS